MVDFDANNAQDTAAAPADEQALLAQLRRASELFSAQRLPEAEAELLGAYRVSPHDLRVLKLLALVRFKLGRLRGDGPAARVHNAPHESHRPWRARSTGKPWRWRPRIPRFASTSD